MKNKPVTNVEYLPVQLNRNSVLDVLSENIQLMNKKVKNNRIRDVKKENVKVAQMKAVVYDCITYNRILKDNQIDYLERELDTIKKVITEEANKEDLAEDLKVVEDTIKKLKENMED